MSEYQTDESIYRLIGPPPGKAGYELGGQLTEAVRRRPFTVILLDELEKANPRILDVFLQLIDDARLTDGQGRTVDFSNSMLIATSNVGTKLLIEGVQKGSSFEDLKEKVHKIIRDKFRPEFLNRFTRIVIYKPLTKQQVKEIAKLLFKSIQINLKRKEIQVKVSNELLEILVEKGYNPLWGARELRRVIRHEIEEKLAKKILKGEIKSGETYTLTPEFLS
jgi:ATP-dependent Clp protease ATP-binding subunit ClpB